MNSVRVTSSTGLSQSWTGRQQTNLGFTFSRQHFISGQLQDSEASGLSVSHGWALARSAGVSLSYAYNRYHPELVSRDNGLSSHGANLGGYLALPISRTRHVTLRGGVGAIYLRAAADGDGELQLAPSGAGSVRLDIGRTWVVSADYWRAAQFLDGVSQTAFVTDSASLSLAGSLGGPFATRLSAILFNGDTPGRDTLTYQGLAAVAQVDVALARCCSAVTSYTHYQHNVRGLSVVPAGFPTRFERDFLRVGMSVQLPLYGNF
jgi:hypothetical protein